MSAHCVVNGFVNMRNDITIERAFLKVVTKGGRDVGRGTECDTVMCKD